MERANINPTTATPISQSEALYESDFGRLIAAHACARSAYEHSSEQGDGPLRDRLEEAERAIWSTRARRPLEIAYKLRLALESVDPEIRDLTPEMVIKLLANDAGNTNAKLIASAFADLYDLDGEAWRAAEADPLPAMIRRIEELLVLEDEADGASLVAQANAYAEERDALEIAASNSQATSLAGAAGQLALVFHQIELIRGNSDQEIRDHHHDVAEGLLKSAMRVLGDHVTPKMWGGYVGGCHPAEPGPTFDARAWIEAYERRTGGKVQRARVPWGNTPALVFSVADTAENFGIALGGEDLYPRDRLRAVYTAAPLFDPADGREFDLSEISAREEAEGRMVACVTNLTHEDREALAQPLSIAAE